MKKKQTDDVADFAGSPAPKALGPGDVQQKEFRVSRFGGYKMRDVDEFLDQITESMNTMVEENRKLRAQGAGSMLGTPDLADTSRQADEIIQRARAQAEQILREAQVDPGALVAGQAVEPTGSASRAPVNAFLAQERSFLQSLASLVQEHAETVKGMVRADRASTPSGPRASAPVAAPPASPPVSSSQPTAPTPEARLSDPRPTVPMTKVDEPEEPIRVDDPVPTSAPGSARRDDDRPGDSADRSLRELFWGED